MKTEALKDSDFVFNQPARGAKVSWLKC
jgi:hypothetical protein